MTEVTVERRNYPILGSKGASIDWQLVVDHGGQAYKNHRQSVERLAERGGLSWVELYAVLNNQQWQKIDENEAIIACRSIEAKYLSAVTEPASTDTLARLQRERDQAVEALREITNPIAAMQQRAEDLGAKLDGAVAFQLANDVGYLQGIARAALAAIEGAEQ